MDDRTMTVLSRREIAMRRFLPDTFTILLVCTVILASLLPKKRHIRGLFRYRH